MTDVTLQHASLKLVSVSYFVHYVYNYVTCTVNNTSELVCSHMHFPNTRPIKRLTHGTLVPDLLHVKWVLIKKLITPVGDQSRDGSAVWF